MTSDLSRQRRTGWPALRQAQDRLSYSLRIRASLLRNEGPYARALKTRSERWDNEALQILDSLVCACVEEPPLQTPPVSPSVGSAYITGASPVGAWSQFPHHLATYTVAGWRFIAPTTGLRALIRTTGAMAVYRGTAWEIGTLAGAKLVIGDQQVVGARGAAVPNPAGGTVIDTQARQAIVDLLNRLRGHGLIA